MKSIRASHTGGTANRTAIFEEFCGRTVTLDARSWKCFSETQGDMLTSLSNLRRTQFELEKRIRRSVRGTACVARPLMYSSLNIQVQVPSPSRNTPFPLPDHSPEPIHTSSHRRRLLARRFMPTFAARGTASSALGRTHAYPTTKPVRPRAHLLRSLITDLPTWNQ